MAPVYRTSSKFLFSRDLPFLIKNWWMRPPYYNFDEVSQAYPDHMVIFCDDPFLLCLDVHSI